MQNPRLRRFATVVILGLSIIAVPGNTAEAADEGKPVTIVTPIFSQLVAMTFPPGFKVAFQATRGSDYIQESVPSAETVHNWTQMITITGLKDLASRPDVTPKTLLETIAKGYQRACPTSFGAKAAFQGKLSGFDAFVAVLSCGTATTPNGTSSETALITVMKGEADLYTIQWAERAAPSETPIEPDMKKWAERFQALNPIKLCSRVPGEPPPYPSCIGS